MLLEVENTSHQRVERGSFVFKPGETRVVELDPTRGNYKEIDGATALRVTDLGAEEMQPLADTGESFEARAKRLKSERDTAAANAESKRRECDQAQAEVASAEDADDRERRNAALSGTDVNDVHLSAPAAKAKAHDLEYQAWAAEIRERETERDYHLALVPVHHARDKAADDRLRQAESAKEAADLELHNAKVAAGRLGYEANREDNLARSAAGKLAQLKRQGEHR